MTATRATDIGAEHPGVLVEISAMTARYTTRYARRPRTTERLIVGAGERWEILEVHDNGLRIVVRDTLGRIWPLERAPHGCWLVEAAR